MENLREQINSFYAALHKEVTNRKVTPNTFGECVAHLNSLAYLLEIPFREKITWENCYKNDT
jgi:hypothetical protein